MAGGGGSAGPAPDIQHQPASISSIYQANQVHTRKRKKQFFSLLRPGKAHLQSISGWMRPGPTTSVDPSPGCCTVKVPFSRASEEGPGMVPRGLGQSWGRRRASDRVSSTPIGAPSATSEAVGLRRAPVGSDFGGEAARCGAHASDPSSDVLQQLQRRAKSYSGAHCATAERKPTATAARQQGFGPSQNFRPPLAKRAGTQLATSCVGDGQGSNPRPLGHQAVRLPTALLAR
jgi:hypothetical protein